jgi:hypothetical protein
MGEQLHWWMWMSVCSMKNWLGLVSPGFMIDTAMTQFVIAGRISS